MLSEKLLNCNEIKKAAPAIMRAGGNAVEILIWSQGKTLDEVKMFLSRNGTLETFKNRKNESICNKDEENRIETTKHNDKVYFYEKGANQDPLKTLEIR